MLLFAMHFGSVQQLKINSRPGGAAVYFICLDNYFSDGLFFAHSSL